MMYKNTVIFLTALSVTSVAFATDVATTPGRLAERLEGLAIPDRSLAITGTLGPDDFETLRTLEGIDRLDLHAAGITEAPLTTGVVEDGHWPVSKALPAYALFAATYKEILLPSGLTQIREGALAATSVEQLTIPEGVTAIGPYALYEASELKRITLPLTLETIGIAAFDGCTSLTSINTGDTKVTTLPERCMARTTSLAEADLSSVTVLGAEALYGSGLKEASLPRLRSAGAFALAGMQRLEKADLPSGVIPAEGMLMDCPKLREVNHAPAVIPVLFAAECPGYSPAEAIKGAMEIGDFAFANTAADSFTLLPGIREIGADAFAGCSALFEIDATALAGYTPGVDSSTFRGINTGSVRLKVADGCEEIWQRHSVWGLFLVYSGDPNGTEGITADRRESFRFGADAEGLHAISDLPGITVEVYTLDGRRVLSPATEGPELTIPLDTLPAGTLVCVARRAGGETRTLKIIH